MELDYLVTTHTKPLASEARDLEFRRVYHELRRADRLQRALISARRRGTLRSLVPASSRPITED